MRILLLTRHYPPAVSGGARRPFVLARELRALGCEVFVAAPTLPEGEPGLAIPHPHRDPPTGASSRRTLRDRAREIVLWPDPDIRWSMRAAHEASARAPWIPDWILTTSPPESIHAAGAFLKRRYAALGPRGPDQAAGPAARTRWLADFRDHWLDRPHRLERAAPHRRFGERLLARRWLARADAATAVDEFVAAELRALGSKAPLVVPHFAPDQRGERISLPASDINVVHAGSIALSDPEARIADLLEPFEAALVCNPNLRLHLVGRLTDAETACVQASPAKARIVAHGVQSFARSLGLQHAADALILVGSRKTRVPPSKLAEYLATDAPVIACGAGEWRKDARIDDVDPVSALAGLRKNAVRARLNRAPAARETAARLLEILRAGD